MAKNENLNKAKNAKNDEFYTKREEIERELLHYKTFFKDKTVYCNCDDPIDSEFWRFFVRVFKDWELKKLIATHYEPNEKNYSYSLEICEDTNGDGRIDMNDEPTVTQLPCNGDFRSAACIELLKESDIVVTNPPFSLFREYIAQLIEYDKKFVVIGPLNAVKYKEIFPLIKANRMWAGFNFNKTMEFIMPDDYVLKGKAFIDENGKKHGFVPGMCWYTNLDIPQRHKFIDLRGNYYKQYKYQKYYNLEAIDIGKTNDIPCDFDGLMGVPISIMENFCPEQFEIVGCSDVADSIPNVETLGQEWIDTYRAQGGTGHYTANMKSLGITNPKHKIVFSRLIIRNKNPEPRRYPDED